MWLCSLASFIVSCFFLRSFLASVSVFRVGAWVLLFYVWVFLIALLLFLNLCI